MRIGLTGGIGSGKSTVAAELVQLGALLFDADAVSRELTAAGGEAMPELIEAFGADIAMADGSLDRGRMRRLAFEHAEQRRRLESILHPLIAARRQAVLAQAGNRPVVFDIPLLAESPAWRARVDRIVVVDCREETQMLRVAARSGLSAVEVRRIMDSQCSRDQRRAVADAVIYNDGIDRQALAAVVQALWRHWQVQI